MNYKLTASAVICAALISGCSSAPTLAVPTGEWENFNQLPLQSLAPPVSAGPAVTVYKPTDVVAFAPPNMPGSTLVKPKVAAVVVSVSVKQPSGPISAPPVAPTVKPSAAKVGPAAALMYTSSLMGNLAQCRGGQWFELTIYVVTSMQTLANGAPVPETLCPGGNAAASTYAALEKAEVTMTGSDVNIQRKQNGIIKDTGAVNQSGVVSVKGTYEKSLQLTSDSIVRVSQGVDVSSGTVVITPADPNARAMVISGCRTNG